MLEDPYREFMVAEDDDESNSSKALVSEDFTTAYWERRYTLRAQQVPAFLVRSADKVTLGVKNGGGGTYRGEVWWRWWWWGTTVHRRRRFVSFFLSA